MSKWSKAIFAGLLALVALSAIVPAASATGKHHHLHRRHHHHRNV